jgi:cathepsin A (carboxypeptidase C)
VSLSVCSDTTRDGYLFFWLHESQGRADDPLVIWLNGGPGCSSLLGMMFECGPLHMDGATGALGVNPYAWNKGAHLLFVEQPVETGFSYSAQHKFVDDEQVRHSTDKSIDVYII